MFKIYCIYIAILSLITFIAYGIDKAKAKTGGYRISEKALLGLSLIGGAVGGILAMSTFRHKTKHWYFSVLNGLGLLIHIGIAVYLIAFI